MAQIRVIPNPSTHVCEICHGVGFLYVPSSPGSAIEVCRCIEEACICDKKAPYLYFDEESRVLKNCSCRETRLKIDRIHRLMHASNLPKKYRYRRLAEFDVSGAENANNKEMLIALDEARHFLEDFRSKPVSEQKGLYLYGPPGTGKTMLASLILNELIIFDQVEAGYIKITRDFFNRIRASFNVESETYGRGDNIFKELSGRQILVIDDFGVQADSEWEKRTLYDLIDARYENEAPTIITSNSSPEEWESLFQGRIYSRLKEMTDFVVMVAADYRNNYMRNQ